MSDSDNSKYLTIKSSSKDLKKSENKLRLALDIGTNSIGWALYNIDKNKKPISIAGAGVRIFSSGRKPKDYTTLNATRRQARLQRRQRDRYLQRRNYLLHLLKKYGLFPEDKFSAKKLADLNPYELRTKGLDKKLDLYHFGRVLFHLNQRRGFKSNRKSTNEKEDGLIIQSVKDSEEQLKKCGARTYGEFLWKRLQKMEESRKTPNSQQENWILARKPIGAGAKENYVVYAQRSMIEDEFNKLWDSQSRYHDILKDRNLRKIFHKAIFHQRMLKKPVVGNCYFTGEKRISKALSSFQKFRVLKELNNLKYYNLEGKSEYITKMKKGIEFRDILIKNLFQKKIKITFSSLGKEFKKFFPNINFVKFNLDTYNRDDLEGNYTDVELSKIITNWSQWPIEMKDRFVEILEGESAEGIFMMSDEEVKSSLKEFNEEKSLNLSERHIDLCLESLKKLPSGHGHYSKMLIQKILPYLEEGKLEDESIRLARGNHSNRKNEGRLLDRLPRYQDLLERHCVDMSLKQSKNSNDKYKTFRIPNPTVHIAFNQLRLLVNDIIKVYGKPQQFVVETARDLPFGQKTKGEYNYNQKKNKELNKKVDQAIRDFGEQLNRDNRIRYKLWEEQQHTCTYSGKKIPREKLFTSMLEVDHILPYSKTLDDSLSNKVLVYKVTNQNKASQTPFEAFSSDKQYWADILQRVSEFPKFLQKKKGWRFNEDAMEQFLKGEDSFLGRQLNDTRYISKYAKEYLEKLSTDVWMVRGQSTSIFRRVFKTQEKNRNDYRNHAQDAIIIGLIDRSMVQKLGHTARRMEGMNKARLEDIGKAIKVENFLPWSSFKKDANKVLDEIIVSHRRRTKKEGQLHNETAYGGLHGISNFSKPIDVIHYVDILSLSGCSKKKLENKVVSEKMRKDFLKELEINTTLSKEFLIGYHKKTGVRRVRLKEKEKVISIKNKSGKIYKYFNGASNYAMQFIVLSNGKWDAKVIDTFSANQKDFPSVPRKSRLMKGDMLFFNNKFWKLVKFDQMRRMVFVEHYISGNPDSLSKDEKTKNNVCRKKPSSLQEATPKRVDISPCGVVKLTNFFLIKTDRKKSEKSA